MRVEENITIEVHFKHQVEFSHVAEAKLLIIMTKMNQRILMNDDNKDDKADEEKKFLVT